MGQQNPQDFLDHAGGQIGPHAGDGFESGAVNAPGRVLATGQRHSGSALPCTTSVGHWMRRSSRARWVSAMMASIWRMVPTGR